MSREVLSPPLMRMGPNRCYRVNLVHEDFNTQYGTKAAAEQQNQVSGKSYAEEDIYGEDYNEELDDEVNCQIEEINNEMFKLALHVAEPFFGVIIGMKGSTKRRIETEAHCDIIIPSRFTQQKNNNSSEIVIKAKKLKNLLLAKNKIELLITHTRKRMNRTHFYGVALNFSNVRENFANFKKQVLSAELPGIEESLFQGEYHMHLTFGVCILMDDFERRKAMKILQSCRDFLNDLNPPFTVHVSGLEIMNDDPSSVRVLYASVESKELQEFSNRCCNRFIQSGLSFCAYGRETVKLHMTVMNNSFRTSNEKSFDAREILKRWGNFDFGSVQCNELLLCVCKSSSRTENTFYKITDSLKF